MDDLERRALMGDTEAQRECTEKEIVLGCPKCGAGSDIFCPVMLAVEKNNAQAANNNWAFIVKMVLFDCKFKLFLRSAMSCDLLFCSNILIIGVRYI